MNDFIAGRRPTSRDIVPAKPHPTDYLKMKKGSQHPLERLYEARDEVGSNCQGREVDFIDYDEPPTDAKARVMCNGCPVFDLCESYAKVGHPAWGVWAGRVHGRELQ